MYSVAFAITVIFCIAVTNLAFGFTAAVLCGRGPRSWSDVGRAIVVRRVVPRRAPKKTMAADPSRSDPPPTHDTPVAAATVTPVPQQPEPLTPIARAPAQEPANASSAPVVDAPVVATAPVPRRRQNAAIEDDRPADVVLHQQLEQWKTEELGDEMPSATMVTVHRPDDGSADDAWPVLLRAIDQTISSQLRRDRCVLRFAENEFVWFTEDVSAEDAFFPAERIRHILENTTFEYQGDMLRVAVHTAVVTVSFDDRADMVLERLRATEKFATQRDGAPIAWDLGNGPQEAEPIEIGIEPSSQVLVP